MACLSCPTVLQRFDVGLELRPACEAVQAGDLKLRVGERRGAAGFEQVLGLILQMAEIGTFGKRAWRSRGVLDMATFFQ